MRLWLDIQVLFHDFATTLAARALNKHGDQVFRHREV